MPLPLRPLRAALLLVEPLRHVVDQHIAREMIQRLGAVDIAAGLADDDAQLDFPVAMRRALGQHHVVVRAGQARQRLHEHHWLGRDRQVRFDRVVTIVEADRDDLADPLQRHAVSAASPPPPAARRHRRPAPAAAFRSSGRPPRRTGRGSRRRRRRRCRVSPAGWPKRQSFMGRVLSGYRAVKGHVGVQLDTETGLVERARPDATGLRHRLAQQLRREHRHDLGRAGCIIRNSANGELWRVTTK